MAKGTRDVELVVRAKNEATKALDAITSALGDLTKAQTTVATNSEKTGSTLNKLGAELDKLISQVKSSTGLDKLAGGFDKANAAVGRLQSGLNQLAEEAVRLDTEIAKSEGTLSRFNNEAVKLKETLKQQQGVTAAAKSEFAKLSNELKAGEAALAGSAKQSQSYIDAIGKQEAKLAKLEERHKRLASAILMTKEPSGRLLDDFEKVDAALRKQVELLANTRGAYATYSAGIRELNTTVPVLRSAVSEAEKSFNEATAAQKRTEVSLRAVDAESRKTAAGLNRLRDAATSNGEAVSRQSSALEQAKQDLVELGRASDSARVKAEQLGNAAFKKVAADAENLTKAKSRLADIEHAFAEAEREGRKFGDMYYGTKFNSAVSPATGYAASAAAVRNLGSASKDTSAALGDMEEKGRAAMTWSQRLKGEMVALTLSFVGLYSAIGAMSKVVKTVVEMDAAQTRLGVAFGDSQATIAKEMRFAAAEADRLGISVKTVVSEYSKMAIGAKGTALEGAELRSIFTSLAEAFRVSGMTGDQMEGSFRAIVQMMSKGKVQAEELRGQLGDRMAGAFNRAANAMGYTTEEFDKLLNDGKVMTDVFLPKFRDELNRTVNTGLGRALEKIGTDLGKFENSVVKAQMAFADGGFTKGLQEALKIINEQMTSDRGLQFFRDLGAIVGWTAKTLAEFTKHGEAVTLILSLLAGKLALNIWSGFSKKIVEISTSLQRAAVATQTTTVAYDALGTPIQRTTAQMGTLDRVMVGVNAKLAASRAAAQGSAVGLTILQGAATMATRAIGLLRGVLAALGGIPGIIITGLSVAFSLWYTRSREIVDVMGEHQKQMDAILAAYDEAAKKGGKWVDNLKGVTTLDIKANLDEMIKQYDDKRNDVILRIASKLGGIRDNNLILSGEFGKQFKRLIEAAKSGEITVTKFREEAAKLAEVSGVNPQIVEVLKEYSGALKDASDLEMPIAKTDKALRDAGITSSSVSAALRTLGADINLVGESGETAADPIKKVEKAIQDLRGQIKEFKEADELAAALKAIDTQITELSNLPGLDKTNAKFKEMLAMAARAKADLQLAFDEKQFKGLTSLLANAQDSLEASAKLLRKFEGFQPTGKWDANAYRAGFGSDTVTLADGTIQKITSGMRVSVEDANRDLIRRIGEFQGKAMSQVGQDRWNTFSTEQQAVLTSIAYNYGSLPERIMKAVRTGTADEISASIRWLAGDNKGVNANRRNQEAFLFAAGNDPEAANKYMEKQIAAADARNKKQEEYLSTLNQELDLKIETATQDLKAQDAASRGRELGTMAQAQELAVRKAIIDAEKQKVTLTDTELAKVRELAALTWQRKKDELDQLKIKEQQQQGEQRIAILEQQRRDIVEQMKLAQQGDPMFNYSELSAKLVQVNDQLKMAIADMITFWEKVGGPEAELKIGSLKLLSASLTEVRDRAKLTAETLGQVFGQNLYSFADNFLAKIRETGDVLGSLRETFQQFISDFLLGLAQAIMKVAIFNALMNISKAMGGGGSFIGAIFQTAAGVKHDGGMVGTGPTRSVSPAWFANAVRYHSGGIAGLKPNEVPTILERGEEVLTQSDPRHVMNGGGAGRNVKIINSIDSGSVVSEGLSTADGERAIFNFIRANKASLKQVLA